MNDELTRVTFINRISNLFRRGNRDAAVLPEPSADLLEENHDTALAESTEPEGTRTTFLRPWSKREQAVEQLQNGVAALSNLMGTIRESLDRQAERQDELMVYLSRLPEVIQTLPENNRVQGEALKAIQAGMEQQSERQNKLASVLAQVHRAGTEQTNNIDGVRERMDAIATHEEAIGLSLTSVNAALEAVTMNSDSSGQVLEKMRENLSSRDGDLEQVIRRQNTRFTTMLTVAIITSIAALTAVVVFGYLGYESISRMAR